MTALPRFLHASDIRKRVCFTSLARSLAHLPRIWVSNHGDTTLGRDAVRMRAIQFLETPDSPLGRST